MREAWKAPDAEGRRPGWLCARGRAKAAPAGDGPAGGGLGRRRVLKVDFYKVVQSPARPALFSAGPRLPDHERGGFADRPIIGVPPCL